MLEIVYINITVVIFLTESFIHRKIGLLKSLLSKGCPDNSILKWSEKNVGEKGSNWILFFLPQ